MATHDGGEPPERPDPFRTSAARRVARRIDEVFSSLEVLPFLRPKDRTEFRYFRRLFRAACLEIDARVERGELRPWSKSTVEYLCAAAEDAFPRSRQGGPIPPARLDPHRFTVPPGPIRVGVFTGSFDPFQMTHLETALRFLSRGERAADLVLVIPEGSYSLLKPDRSEYGYRYDILHRQATEAFRPFIVPLDIGEAQDTIGIVRRLIDLFAGRELNITHVLGSDVFPFAAKWYPKDMETWRREALNRDVVLDFGAFVVKRNPEDRVAESAREARKLDIPVQLDPRPIGTPSSTQLREGGVFTIIFPTAEVLEKLEVVFRYGMHRHWLTERGGAEYEI
jgi:hypothetical protein